MCYSDKYKREIKNPIPADKGAPRLRALNCAPLTLRKVEASRRRIKIRNQPKFALFAVNIFKLCTRLSP